MNATIAKIVALSILVLTAACSEKVAPESEQKQKEEVSQKKNDDKKAPLSQFKAVPLPDKSTYKNPTF